MNILKEMKQVLSIQIDSLKDMQASLGQPFEQAVKIILKCRGKVIVTGIGKSGLIAQKMASTLSSTGTPALYLHPADAIHGNLGVIQKNDIVLAVGKSGESEEVLAILPAIKKIGVKFIAITANKNSSLAKQAHILLWTPIKIEACPFNLAPTTSSTVALVVGDALAITLMKLRGFSKEKFALYHPGGLLGKRLLLKVSDVMRAGLKNPMVNVNQSVQKLLEEISNKWTGAASIVDSKRHFVGLVTDFDIRHALMTNPSIMKMKISDLMNSNPVTIFSDEMATKAVEIMELRKKPITVLPVLNRQKKSVGMIHLHDLVVRGLTSDPSELR